MSLFTMAWRNIIRNRRRSMVTIFAMSFALFFELFYAGLVAGYTNDMENSITDLEVGDIQIHAVGYLETPSLYKVITDSDTLIMGIEGLGLSASSRLKGGGLAASGENSAGVSLRGLDVHREKTVSNIHERIREGEWLDPSDSKGVVLGKNIAKSLGVSAGSELVIVTQACDGSMGNDLFIVRGILGPIAQGTDSSAVLMNQSAFRKLMVFPNGSHQVVVRRGEAELSFAANQIKEMNSEVDVKTWKEILPIVAQMLEAQKGMIFIIYFIIYIAVGILILNAMLTSVFERIKEFGVLKAIGAGPIHVFLLIFIESILQTAIAMVMGTIFALPVMWYVGTYGINVGALGGMDAMGVAFSEIWIGIYNPQTLAGPYIMLWVVAIGAIMYPALQAALINPITAMRHQ